MGELAESGGARVPEPLRVVRDVSQHAFARTQLVEAGGRLWLHKRLLAPAPLGRALGPATRALMRHELANCLRLEGVPGVAWRALPHSRDAFLREWVEGVDLRAHGRAGGRLPDDFFDELWRILSGVHARGMAYNDLEKKDNVLVTGEGRPVLIDFQISLRRYQGRGRALRALSGWAVRELQRQDVRYFCKMKQRFRPDLLTPREAGLVARRSGLSRAYHPIWRVLHRIKRWLVPKGAHRIAPFRRRERGC